MHTVEEAGEALRIGRTHAYALAHRYEASGGATGLPVVRLGNCLRVPRWALLVLCRTGHVVTLSELLANTDELVGRLQESVAPNDVDQHFEVDQSPSPQPKRVNRSTARSARAAHDGQQLVLLQADRSHHTPSASPLLCAGGWRRRSGDSSPACVRERRNGTSRRLAGPSGEWYRRAFSDTAGERTGAPSNGARRCPDSSLTACSRTCV